jgi:hypothetical protein
MQQGIDWASSECFLPAASYACLQNREDPVAATMCLSRVKALAGVLHHREPFRLCGFDRGVDDLHKRMRLFGETGVRDTLCGKYASKPCLA